MSKPFTAEKLAKFYSQNHVYEHPEGIAIAPLQNASSFQSETFIVPRIIPLGRDLCTPVDLTKPFPGDIAEAILHEFGAAEYARYTYDMSLRFGIHWRDGDSSFFRITRPREARHIQLIARVDVNYRLQTGLMDGPSLDEKQLRQVADYTYETVCRPPYLSSKYQIFIIPCDHLTEAAQQKCDGLWYSWFES